MNVREAKFDDHQQIADLVRQYELEAKGYDEWAHLWKDNPVYLSRKDKWPIGWVLEDNNKVVGYIGNIPLVCKFKGKELIIAAAHAWVVDEKYRDRSLALVSKYLNQKNANILLNTTANAGTSKVFDAFKVPRIPEGQSDTSCFWITNSLDFAGSFLKLKKAPLPSILKFFMSTTLFLNEKLFIRPRKLKETDEIIEKKTFDYKFDDFWDELQKQDESKILTDRSSKALNWHFKFALRENKLRIFTLEKENRIQAYAIFYREDNPKYHLKRLRLIDFQTIDPRESVLVTMLSHARKICRKEKIHMLESIGFCSDKRDTIQKYAPYRRRLPTWLYFYKTQDKTLAKELDTPSAWDPSAFDGDGSL